MTSTFQSSNSGLRATNVKFFDNDIYVPSTIIDATVDVSVALKKLQSTSYGGGQVTLTHGYDQDTLAAANLQYTVNAGGARTPLNLYQ